MAFVTLTGPSFGPVHTAAGGPRSEATRILRSAALTSRCACGQRHALTSGLVGCPIDPSGYGYRPSVRFNSPFGALYTRTLAELRRVLAGRGELPAARVVEFQARGVAHLHAIVMLGDLDADAATFRDVCAAVAVRDDTGTRFRWGRQLDVALLSTDRSQWMREQGIVTSYVAKTAGYLLKDRFVPDSQADQPITDVQARRDFEGRLASAARWMPGLSRRRRESYGVTAQILRASNSWPAANLVERRRERAAYGRARAQAEGLASAEITKGPETALPRY